MPVIPQVGGELRSYVGSAQGVGDSGIARMQGEAVENLGRQLGQLARVVRETDRETARLNARSAAAKYEALINKEIETLRMVGPKAYTAEAEKTATPEELSDRPAFALEVLRRRGESIASEISETQFGPNNYAHNAFITEVNQMYGSKYLPKAQLIIAEGIKSEGIVALKGTVSSLLDGLRNNPDDLVEVMAELTGRISSSTILTPKEKADEIQKLSASAVDTVVRGFAARREYAQARAFMDGVPGSVISNDDKNKMFDYLEKESWEFETQTHLRSERERTAEERRKQDESEKNLNAVLRTLSLNSTEEERNNALEKLAALRANGQILESDFQIAHSRVDKTIEEGADMRRIFPIVDSYLNGERTRTKRREAENRIRDLARNKIIDPAAAFKGLSLIDKAEERKVLLTAEKNEVIKRIIAKERPLDEIEAVMMKIGASENLSGILSPAGQLAVDRVLRYWRGGGNPLDIQESVYLDLARGTVRGGARRISPREAFLRDERLQRDPVAFARAQQDAYDQGLISRKALQDAKSAAAEVVKGRQIKETERENLREAADKLREEESAKRTSEGGEVPVRRRLRTRR